MSNATVQISAEDLLPLLGSEAEPFLLDVREPGEVSDWPFPGATNIPMSELSLRANEIPRDEDVVVLCATGRRSNAAVNALQRAGWNARELCGGMAAWANVYDTVTLEAGSAAVVQVRRRAKGCLSYVVGAGDEAFVIDPSADTDRYLAIASEHGWRITRVFDTHLHADHLSGARALARASGASLSLNPLDHFHFDFEHLTDGQRFALPGGAELSVDVLHTPGHTEGSTIYHLGDLALFTGDTLFVEGVGRPDLAERAEEFARQLYRSLQERVLTLDDTAIVLPAHHGTEVSVSAGKPVGATLGELRESLALLGLDESSFVQLTASRVRPRPPHYERIVVANQDSDPDALPGLRGLEAGPNRCAA